ncbi:hypothetical protein [Natronorubrum halophilum]|nr:hypothetical protein [Natronorubrum halophilum]
MDAGENGTIGRDVDGIVRETEPGETIITPAASHTAGKCWATMRHRLSA